MKLALCQLKVGSDKGENLIRAEALIREAAAAGADMVALPEMFNCPYVNRMFPLLAEEGEGLSFKTLARIAGTLGIWLVGGSIPEREGERIYNTCFVFDREGRLVARHRKVHLFDVDIKGGISLRESDVLSPGDSLTTFDTEYGRVGVAICYDVRFPEMFRRMAQEGAFLMVLPAAFSMTTGPAHWDLLMRSRALDNQCYFAAISPARDAGSRYISYGHSCIVSPWGEYCGLAGAEEAIVYGDIDLAYLDTVREQMPLTKQRRPEIY